MWTWTYEAHEFTHDNNNNQVMALFSLSLSPEREEQKKRNSFYEGFFRLRTGRFFLAFLARRSLSQTETSLVYAEFNLRRYLHQRIVVERWSFCLDLVVRTL